MSSDRVLFRMHGCVDCSSHPLTQSIFAFSLPMHLFIYLSIYLYSKHEKRTGPGRRSNAEHAIAFYEYVLEEAEEGEESDEGEGQKQASKEEGTVVSIDSQEFLNEHNDLCDVCNLGGELLCCSTCNLVFHLECVRPILHEMPPNDDWSCAHCIIAGVKGHKRNSKVWKSAAAGVRLMGRLRNSKKREMERRDNPSKDDGSDATDEEEEDDEDKSSSEAQTESQHNKSGSGADKDDEDDKDEEGEETEKKRRNLALFKISDSYGGSENIVKGRRARKQPTLYNPQNCPASEWQSDERAQWLLDSKNRSSSSSDDESDEDDEKPNKERKKTPGSDNEEASEGNEGEDSDSEKSLWCNFCKDDPSVPVCVFCACRVCFGKHEKSKLLICDECEDEYHTFCLDPPLSSVPPASKKWFCPTCRVPEEVPKTKISTRRGSLTSPKGDTNTATPRSSIKKEKKSPMLSPEKTANKTPTKRPRGRPPKTNKPLPSSTTLTPRKRGRPPKTASPAPSQSTQTLSSPADNPSPRKRGRPPKHATPVSSPQKKIQKMETTNKRGASTSPGKRMSADSAKKARVESTPTKEEEPPQETELVKVSRSGRTLKRNSFHDEREEGEQHLRSPQYQAKMQQRNDLQRKKLQEKETAKKKEEAKKKDESKKKEEAKKKEETKRKEEAKRREEGKRKEEAKRKEEKERAAAKAAIAKKAAAEKGEDMEETSPEIPVIPVLPMQDALVTPVPTKPTPAPVRESPPPPPEPLPPPTRTEPKPEQAPEIPIVRQLPPVPAQEKASTEPTAQKSPVQDKPVPVLSDPAPTVTAPSADIATAAPQPAPAPAPAPISRPKKELPPGIDIKALVADAIRNMPPEVVEEKPVGPVKIPRRKPGARECMQISRRFGVKIITKKYMDTLLDYCTRGKVEHLIRMRERLDEHSRFLEAQLAGLEALVLEKGETDVVVPPLPERQENKPQSTQQVSKQRLPTPAPQPSSTPPSQPVSKPQLPESTPSLPPVPHPPAAATSESS